MRFLLQRHADTARPATNSANCVSFSESENHYQSSVLLVLVQVFDCLGHSGLGLSFNLSCRPFLGLAGPRPCLEGLEGLVRLVLLFLAFQDLVHVL